MEYTTQMDAARKGIITPQMKIVAQKEYMEEEKLRALVAEGKVAICANKNHKCLNPEGVGSMLKTKINANIGAVKGIGKGILIDFNGHSASSVCIVFRVIYPFSIASVYFSIALSKSTLPLSSSLTISSRFSKAVSKFLRMILIFIHQLMPLWKFFVYI